MSEERNKYSFRFLIVDILMFTLLHELGHLIPLFLFGGTLYSICVPEWLSFLVYWDVPLIDCYNQGHLWKWSLNGRLNGVIPLILELFIIPFGFQMIYTKFRNLQFKWVIPIVLLSHKVDLQKLFTLVIPI